MCMRWRTRTRLECSETYTIRGKSSIYEQFSKDSCVWGDAHEHECRETYIDLKRALYMGWFPKSDVDEVTHTNTNAERLI